MGAAGRCWPCARGCLCRGVRAGGDGARDARAAAPLVAAPAPAASTRGAFLRAAATRQERLRAACRPRGGRAVAAPPCARAGGRLFGAVSCGRPPGGCRLAPAAAASRRLFTGIAHCRRGRTVAGGSGWVRPPPPLPPPPPRRRGVARGRLTRPAFSAPASLRGAPAGAAGGRKAAADTSSPTPAAHLPPPPPGRRRLH